MNMDFKSYYTRCWIDKKGNKWMDVGSHTELFLLSEEELDEDEFVSGGKWRINNRAENFILNNHQQSIKN